MIHIAVGCSESTRWNYGYQLLETLEKLGNVVVLPTREELVHEVQNVYVTLAVAVGDKLPTPDLLKTLQPVRGQRVCFVYLREDQVAGFESDYKTLLLRMPVLKEELWQEVREMLYRSTPESRRPDPDWKPKYRDKVLVAVESDRKMQEQLRDDDFGVLTARAEALSFSDFATLIKRHCPNYVVVDPNLFYAENDNLAEILQKTIVIFYGDFPADLSKLPPDQWGYKGTNYPPLISQSATGEGIRKIVWEVFGPPK